MGTFEVRKAVTVSAAHSLRDYDGPCAHNHGHNWKVEVVVRAGDTAPNGLVMDFSDLKAALEKILAPFDHADMNRIAPFDSLNPTSENLARYVYERLSTALPRGLRLARVNVSETDDSAASYFEEGS